MMDSRLSRCTLLWGFMEEILGEPIPKTSREPMYVWERAMVAYQLIKEGYTTTEIGRYMEKNHSSISHLKSKVMDMLHYPQYFKDITPLWEQFQKRIENDIQSRTTDNPLSV